MKESHLNRARRFLQRRGIELPVYWGNRNWAPYLEEAVTDAAAAGDTSSQCGRK